MVPFDDLADRFDLASNDDICRLEPTAELVQRWMPFSPKGIKDTVEIGAQPVCQHHQDPTQDEAPCSEGHHGRLGMRRVTLKLSNSANVSKIQRATRPWVAPG